MGATGKLQPDKNFQEALKEVDEEEAKFSQKAG